MIQNELNLKSENLLLLSTSFIDIQSPNMVTHTYPVPVTFPRVFVCRVYRHQAST